MGLTLAASGGTCQITGSPTVTTPTIVTHTITATNGISPDDTATIKIFVESNLAEPSLGDTGVAVDGSDASAVVITEGEEIAPITFRNAGGAVAEGGCTIDAEAETLASLPNGLTLEAFNGTCRVTGTPTDVSLVGFNKYTIKGTNGGGSDDCRCLALRSFL